jgi:hypothetical protein
MKENGWAIAADELAAKRQENAETTAPTAAPVRRLRGTK